MTERWFRPHLVCMTALILTGGCQEEPSTWLVVDVKGKKGTVAPRTLHVTFTHNKQDHLHIFSRPGSKITLPTSFSIQADGRHGAAQVSVEAQDENQREVAAGQGKGNLITDEATRITIDLYPADFPVNNRYQTSQLFSSAGPPGRQLASDAQGNFVAVWEDSCPLSRCDVWYRLFNSDGAAKLNAVTNKTEEYQANYTNNYYDMPAIARQVDGNFVTVWYRSDKSSSMESIRSRAFLSDGKPVNDSEQLLSRSTANSPESPDIAVLSDKNYVAVWHESSSTGYKVMGRLLNAQGKPIKPTSLPDDAFEIAAFTASASSTAPTPVVAADPDKTRAGFMVAWRQNGNLWGRTYGNKVTSPTQPFNISNSGKVQEINIGPLPYGYVSIWSDRGQCDADKNGACIRMRRYDRSGNAMGTAFVLNTYAPGDQLQPAIAARNKDGSLLAVWSSTQAPSDPQGGIRGRMILHNGSPVGDEFQINTTTTKQQDNPSVAAHTTDSFAVVFVDQSGLGPDTSGASIRGRLVYVTFAPKDGLIGALCDSNPCGASYKCLETNKVGKRCHSMCPAGTCPHGGSCKNLSAGDKVCLYNTP